MPLRAIDFHVHLPTPDWLDGSMAGYVEAAEAYFRSSAQRASLDELAALYRTGSRCGRCCWPGTRRRQQGGSRVPNETVAAACRDYPDVFTGLGSVDPHKGEAAVAEVENIAALGLRGSVSTRPCRRSRPTTRSTGRSSRRASGTGCWRCSTPGPAASAPGSPAARASGSTWPIRSSSTPVAAAHPGLTVVAAHFGWPWQMDLIAIALHKTNVYIDISGWAPRRIPAEVLRELRGRLSGQFLWGSDYPFISPERCLSEFDELDVPPEVRTAVLHDNAARVLGL